MAASLKGLSPELRKYLRVNKLPDIYEVSLIDKIIELLTDSLS